MYSTYLYLQILAVISFSLLNFRELQDYLHKTKWKPSEIKKKNNAKKESSVPFFGCCCCRIIPLYSSHCYICIYLIVFIASVMWSQNGGRFSTAYIQIYRCGHAVMCVACVELQNRYRNAKRTRRSESFRVQTDEKKKKEKRIVKFPRALNRPICQPENALCCFIWLLRVFAHHCVLREMEEIVIKLMGAVATVHFWKKRWNFFFLFYYFVTDCGYTFSTRTRITLALHKGEWEKYAKWANQCSIDP